MIIENETAIVFGWNKEDKSIFAPSNGGAYQEGLLVFMVKAEISACYYLLNVKGEQAAALCQQGLLVGDKVKFTGQPSNKKSFHPPIVICTDCQKVESKKCKSS